MLQFLKTYCLWIKGHSLRWQRLQFWEDFLPHSVCWLAFPPILAFLLNTDHGEWNWWDLESTNIHRAVDWYSSWDVISSFKIKSNSQSVFFFNAAKLIYGVGESGRRNLSSEKDINKDKSRSAGLSMQVWTKNTDPYFCMPQPLMTLGSINLPATKTTINMALILFP